MVQLLCIGNAFIFGKLIYFDRAAEVGTIECAQILLEFNADIDALNFSG